MTPAALMKPQWTSRSLRLLLSLGLWSGLLVGLVIGVATPAAAQSGDPPARVARVAEVIGDVWMFDTETKEWTRVTRNQTVGEGDRLRTDERSRVSLRIGSTSVWIDERTDLAFDQLDEGQVLMVLDKGDVGLRLRAQDAASDFRIRTREGLMFTERDGLYRVEQLDRGSKAYVFSGRLRFESGRGRNGNTSEVPPVWLQNNEQAEFWWANGARVERQRLETDGFGDWLVSQNNRDDDRRISQRYVSPEMTGAEDLDRHGRWETADNFGSVWIPYSVNTGWVPYRDGRWVWTRHWGWSWVDDAPWGFAPFHYGRWVQWGGRWCWAPGQYVARPVYAPALVAWVGGPSLNVGFQIGGGNRLPPPRYGWVPLAPREAYVPGYRHSPTYVIRVNNGDHASVPPDRPYRNQNVGGAVSYLPGQGGAVRALPPADGVGPMRPVLTPIVAPSRGDFSGIQPLPRPVVELRPSAGPGSISNQSNSGVGVVGPGSGAGQPWRSDGERRRWGGQREEQQPPRQQPAFQQPQQLQQPQQPQRDRPALTPATPLTPLTPVPSVTVDSQQQLRAPDRATDHNNRVTERVGPGRPTGFERQQQEQRPFEAQQLPPPRQAEQRPVEPARQTERQRPVEMPPQARPPQAQPQAQPQVMQQPAAPVPRAEDRGPQRSRQDGPRPARDRDRNENER